MNETFLLITGSAILVVVLFDFFSTTLSGNGAGLITEYTAIVSDKIIRSSSKIFGRKIFNYRGLLVNLIVLIFWIILIWAGLFLLFSSNPDAIVNGDGKVANVWERLYFTGYTISTLGMGNFTPTSAFFEIMTGIFSIIGFIFFTTSMTYFISVSSALVNKRTITKSVTSLGDTPQKISKQLLSLSSSHFFQQLVSLQSLIDRHTVHHHSYPVVHFYSNEKREDSFSLNFSRLDEALSILAASKNHEYHEDIKSIRESLAGFIKNLNTKFSASLPKAANNGDFSHLPYEIKTENPESLQNRRQTLERLLRSEGYNISDLA